MKHKRKLKSVSYYNYKITVTFIVNNSDYCLISFRIYFVGNLCLIIRSKFLIHRMVLFMLFISTKFKNHLSLAILIILNNYQIWFQGFSLYLNCPNVILPITNLLLYRINFQTIHTDIFLKRITLVVA